MKWLNVGGEELSLHESKVGRIAESQFLADPADDQLGPSGMYIYA